MNRPAFNYTLDWSAFVLFAGLAGTGLLIHYTLPPGSGQASVFGLTRHEWGEVHFWIAAGFLGIVAVHLLLHAKWIASMTGGKARGRRRRVRIAVASAAAIVLIGIAAAALLAPVQGTIGNHRESVSGETAAVPSEGNRESHRQGEGRDHDPDSPRLRRNQRRTNAEPSS